MTASGHDLVVLGAKEFFLVLGLSTGLLPALPADYGQRPEWDRQYDQSYAMAVKMFPDVAVKDSQLNVIMEKMLWVLGKNDSQIAHLSCAPVVVAMEAADILKLQPNWKALSDQEKDEVFRDIRTSLVSTYDFSVAEAQANNRQAPAAPASPGIAAFHCYLFQTVVGLERTGRVYSGPYQGMMDGEGTAAAQQKWLSMTDDEKAVYEKMAEETGDPIAQQQPADANAPVPVRVLQGQGE